MKLTNYTEDPSLDEVIKKTLESTDGFSQEEMISIIKGLIIEGYSHGMVDSIVRDKEKHIGVLKKSKELTSFLPSKFIKGETGSKLTNTLMQSIKELTTEEGDLVIGYELSLIAIVQNIIRIAYSVGVSIGFKVSTDNLMSNMFKENERRFLTSDKQ